MESCSCYLQSFASNTNYSSECGKEFLKIEANENLSKTIRRYLRSEKMIQGVIIMNDQGQPRLIKFYEFKPAEKQQELVRSIYRILCSRAENASSFVRVDSLFGPDVRLVYKTYATLYFVFIFDESENELAMLDLMQVFVETLDKCLNNVCELDVVFNFNKVHTILDEIILSGQVLETSISEVMKAVQEISRM